MQSQSDGYEKATDVDLVRLGTCAMERRGYLEDEDGGKRDVNKKITKAESALWGGRLPKPHGGVLEAIGSHWPISSRR